MYMLCGGGFLCTVISTLLWQARKKYVLCNVHKYFSELPMYIYTDSTSGKAEHCGSSAVLLFILWYAIFMYLVTSEILWRGLKVVLVWNELLSEMCFLMLDFSSHMTKLYTGHQVFKKYFERVLVQMRGEGSRVILVPHWIYVVNVFTQI